MKNVILGVNKRGELIERSSKVPNGHICITGKSGTGKSSAMMSMLIQSHRAGDNVIVINMHRCFDIECMMPQFHDYYSSNSMKIDVARDHLKLPLFTVGTDINGEEELVESVIGRVNNLLKKAGKLTGAQSAVVKRAVKDVFSQNLYHDEGICSIMRYLEAQDYKTAHNAAGKISSICDTNCFVDGNFLDEIDGNIVELDLNGLQYDDQVIVADAIIDTLLRFANLGRFTEDNLTLVIDECQNFDFSSGSTMFSLINESRKLGINVILATPRLLTSGKQDMRVIQQCGTLMFFQPIPEDRRKLGKQINPGNPDSAVFNLSELKVGQCMLSGMYCNNGSDAKKPLVVNTYFPKECLKGMDATIA